MTEPWGLKFLTFLTILLGFSSLFLLPGISPLALLFIIFLLVPGWFVPVGLELPRAYKISWTVALGVFFLISFLENLYVSHPAYLTLAYQLSFVQLYKVFNRRSRGDYIFIWLISFVMLLLAIMVTQSVALSILFIPFVVVSTVLFTFSNIVKEVALVEQAQPENQRPRVIAHPSVAPHFLGHLPGLRQRIKVPIEAGRLPHRLNWHLSGLGVACLLLSWLIFLTLPGLGLYPAGLSSLRMSKDSAVQCLSNFTTNLRLGSMRPLLSDSTPVLKMKLYPTQGSKGIYLRGATLDYFTGWGWERSSRARIIAQQFSAIHKGLIVLNEQLYNRTAAQKFLKQEITYLQGALPYILGMPEMIAVEGINNNMYRDMTGTLNVMNFYDIKGYTVHSWPHYPLEDTNIEALHQNYLQLPDYPAHERIKEFAYQLTPNLSGDYEKARAIEQYLRDHYSYSLTSHSSLNRFLFEEKTGYCEYFASAMVLLLRHLGIPARLAVGFYVDMLREGAQGRVEDESNEVFIRRQNAHAWVEAYIAGQGWHQFDPTPPSPFPVYGPRLTFKKFYDLALRLTSWWEKIVSLPGGKFSPLVNGLALLLNKGLGELSSLARGLGYFWQKLRQGGFHSSLIFIAIAILSIDIVLIRLYYRLRHYLLAHGLAGRGFLTRKLEIESLYRQILRRIGARQRWRTASLTAREFALSSYQGAQKDVLEELLALYYSLRFGARPFSPVMRSNFARLLRQL